MPIAMTEPAATAAALLSFFTFLLLFLRRLRRGTGTDFVPAGSALRRIRAHRADKSTTGHVVR
jgi:hypothetical protein